MAERELSQLLSQLQSTQPSTLSQVPQLLARAKLALLKLNALVPSPQTSAQNVMAAREVLEIGALISIRLKDTEAFTRYFQQLQPFYTLAPEKVDPSAVSSTRSGRPLRSAAASGSGSADGSNRSKITGLFLLLLLSQGDYSGFHTEIERLEAAAEQGKGSLEDDAFIAYPIRLEQALMEGSYDRVWGETKGERVPSEEFAIFSEVLITTIRAEIASCSERAYPSLPISNAKNLLFLDSEGAVVEFARARGWKAQDGRIYFPAQEEASGLERDVLAASGQVIENTLGYARKLETIV